uniref:Putative E3 ubiquitin-protein ligase ARI6 n=2 Tax=Gadus morhua TaxID=8049 RepID=A0A8C5CF32_GADMO
MHQPLTPSGAVLTSFSLVIFPGLEGETRRYRQFCDLPSSRYSLRVRGHGKEPKKMSVEKAYDPSDPSFKFVDRPDEIDPLQDESCRAEMSCGHAVTPGSLTGWCRSLLSQGQSKFICPALQPDGKKCGAEWSYQEVRRFALLTVEEMDHFEKELACIVAPKFKACPGCKTYVERQALDNLCFQCTICKESNKPTKQFCWQCLRPWKGRAPRSDSCDNDDCSDKVLDLLKGCDTMTLSQVPGVGPCPSIRACPTCGMKVEHNQKACKNILCPRCQVEFCFVCLKLKKKCCETSNSYTACSSGVAPRQTAIPTWN